MIKTVISHFPPAMFLHSPSECVLEMELVFFFQVREVMRSAGFCPRRPTPAQGALVTEGILPGVKLELGFPGTKKHSSPWYYLDTEEINDLLFNCKRLPKLGSL